MKALIARVLLLLVVLTLAVPESYAKRVGGGRSSGRQSQVVKHRSAPARVIKKAPVQRAQAEPLPPPPAPPQQTLPQQASHPWGGMLGGALLGLGLGSMMSSDERDADTAVNQSEGGSGSGSSASGPGESQPQAAQNESVPQNKLGPALLLAIFALAVVFIVRRACARRDRYIFLSRNR
jgi:hypothetical protein